MEFHFRSITLGKMKESFLLLDVPTLIKLWAYQRTHSHLFYFWHKDIYNIFKILRNAFFHIVSSNTVSLQSQYSQFSINQMEQRVNRHSLISLYIVSNRGARTWHVFLRNDCSVSSTYIISSSSSGDNECDNHRERILIMMLVTIYMIK